MTDIVALARRLFRIIKWQQTLEDVGKEELTEIIAESIRKLYVATGRARLISEDAFKKDGDLYISFGYALREDEVQWVLLEAQISFFTMVQNEYTDMVGFTTNALTLTHGDKPFKNIQERIDTLSAEQIKVWYKMNRFHHLGGVVI